MIAAECPAIPGCVSQGLTEAEAMDNLREAIDACLEARAEAGMPLTIAVHQTTGSAGRRRKWIEAELLKRVTPKMVGGEVDWGEPVGKEVW